MISDEMIKAMEKTEIYEEDEGYIEDRKIAQAATNAAWTDFDPKDESTWPDEPKLYYVECNPEYTAVHQIYLWSGISGIHYGEWAYVIRYADPSTLRKEG